MSEWEECTETCARKSLRSPIRANGGWAFGPRIPGSVATLDQPEEMNHRDTGRLSHSRKEKVATDGTRIKHGSESAGSTSPILRSVFHPCFIRGSHFFRTLLAIGLIAQVAQDLFGGDEAVVVQVIFAEGLEFQAGLAPFGQVDLAIMVDR